MLYESRGVVLLQACLSIMLSSLMLTVAFDAATHTIVSISRIKRQSAAFTSMLTVFDIIIRDIWCADPNPKSWSKGEFVKKMYDDRGRQIIARVRYESRKDGLMRIESRFDERQARWGQPWHLMLRGPVCKYTLIPIIKEKRVHAAWFMLDNKMSMTVRLRNTHV